MAPRPIKIELDLTDKNVQSKFKEIADAAGEVEEGVEKVTTAGKAMADAMQRSADEMIVEIDQTKAAVDALENALGPGFDVDTRKVVQELKSVGLTAEQIEADADELAAALRRADDVKLHAVRQGFDDIHQATGRVTEGANQNRAVIANFAGNAAQELPLVTGAFGPLGMAIGQTVEYATEGNIALKNMLVAGLGMAAVTGVMMGINGYMQDIADSKAFEERKVNEWKHALTESETVVEGMLEKARELEAIEFNKDKWTVPGGAGFMHEVEDITSLMYKAQITGEQWYTAMSSGGAEWQAMLRDIASNTRLTKEEQDTLLDAYMDGTTQMSDAKQRAIEEQFVYGEATDEATEATEAHTAAVFSHAERTKRMSIETIAASRALDEKAQSDKEAAHLADLHNRAMERLTQRYEEMSDELSDRSAYLGLGDAFDALQTAAEEAWTASANGAEDAEQKARDYQQQQISLKQEVISYAEEVGNIPPQTVSEIIALIDNNALEEAERKLAQLERERIVNVRINTGQVNPNLPGKPGSRYASGTEYANEGDAWVGEEGPEIVRMPSGAQVIPAHRAAGMKQQAQQGSFSETHNYFITMPAGSDPNSVIRASRRGRRRNGGIGG